MQHTLVYCSTVTVYSNRFKRLCSCIEVLVGSTFKKEKKKTMHSDLRLTRMVCRSGVRQLSAGLMARTTNCYLKYRCQNK